MEILKRAINNFTRLVHTDKIYYTFLKDSPLPKTSFSPSDLYLVISKQPETAGLEPEKRAMTNQKHSRNK